MNKLIALEDIQSVIDRKQLIPTITMWNRLECRPRTGNFDRALKAEVRDALFLLTKQWQMGEFKGDDAGSPVIAKVHIETTRLDTYKADNRPAQPFEYEVPLEVKVEQRMLPFAASDQELSLDIRLLMGRQWLKLMDTTGLGALRGDFIAAFPIRRPDPDRREDAQICAHTTAWQQYAAVAERAVDGAALYVHLTENAGNHAYDPFTDAVRTALTPDQIQLIEKTELRFITWFERLFYQPRDEGEDAWVSSRLEYQFACSAPKKGAEKIFTAEEYYHGHLDWYNLNVNTSIETLGDVDRRGVEPTDPEQVHTYSFLPAQIQFDGMPNARWWAFEEGRTNFGDIKPDTTDLNKLLLIEFGLVYANDWFLLPFTLPAGSVADVRGMTVTNVFGERIWVEPAGAGADEDWQRWSLFTLNVDGAKDAPVETSLLLLPTVPKIQEGRPIEEIFLIRDETANMVWGIETRILLPSGASIPGGEAAKELRTHYDRIVEKENASAAVPAPEREYKADIRYRIMTMVPENWIPFVPVHVEGDNREIQLQRAAMPRIIEGDVKPVQKIRPRSKLLRVGLDGEPKTAYTVFEEEVPRSGVRVYQSYQRTRWYRGRVFNWLGVRKQTGRGEGSSGLRFDQIVTNTSSRVR